MYNGGVRGVVFIGGERPRAGSVAALAGEGVLVVAADSGVYAAEDWGAEPDWIVGDMDSLDHDGVLSKYPKSRVLRYPRDKDFTDTELAIELLFDKGCDEVILIGGGGGRLAHTLALVSLFERKRPPVRWLTAREDIFFVEGRRVIETGAGALVSVFPLGAGPWLAESERLKWPLRGLAWERGCFGISNIATGDTVNIDIKQGSFLFIIEQNGV